MCKQGDLQADFTASAAQASDRGADDHGTLKASTPHLILHDDAEAKQFTSALLVVFTVSAHRQWDGPLQRLFTCQTWPVL